MAEKYVLSQAAATGLAGVLGQGQAAASARESADVYNLLAASMCQMTAAIKEIQEYNICNRKLCQGSYTIHKHGSQGRTCL